MASSALRARANALKSLGVIFQVHRTSIFKGRYERHSKGS